MNDDPLPTLRDVLVRRPLNPAEERRLAEWLERHPEAATEWNEDRALSRGLRAMAPVPVPSNFTARVLDELRRDAAREMRDGPTLPAWLAWRRWLRWWPGGAAAAVAAVVIALGFGYVGHRQREYREHLAVLRVLAEVPPQVLEDFEAIQRFERGPSPVDYELLAALQ